ncbi:MAG TPA: MFS transporter [Syntrophales bacterium]|nr:MFS transporter [Syntrophales bacterium]HOL59635.1 MFS transporter [Syntrophales bacterium]HPO35781.1 MFS transporter [Syntrophales bacterium]
MKTPSYGWLNVLAVMIVYGGLCGNVTYAYGVFLPAMSETWQWPRAALSGPYTLFLLVGGLLGPLAGITCARFGPRLNIIVSNFIAAVGLLCMSQMKEIWHAYLFFGLFCGLGIAFGEFIPSTTVVNNWFVKKRSLAMGMLFAAGGIGGFIMPPLIGYLITRWGWPATWVFLGIFHLFFVSLLGGLLIRNRPEDEVKRAPNGFMPQEASNEWQVGEAIRTPALWLIVWLFAAILFVVNILSTHQVSYLEECRYSPLFAASALGFMLGVSIVGRLLAGYLGTIFDGRKVLFVSFLLTSVGLLCLIHAGLAVFVYLYAIFVGLGFGGTIVTIPGLTADFFGRAHYSRLMGWVAPIITVAGAISPLLAGYLRDWTGSYRLPFVIALFVALGGALCSMLMKAPVKKSA